MTAKVGGSRVEAGFYWSPAEWEVVTISGEGGTLPGAAEARYHRIPAALMLLAAPLMGAAFVVFLPFIGFALLLTYAGRRGLAIARTAADGLVAVLRPVWAPGVAYFTGRRERRRAAPRAPQDEQAPWDAER